VISIYPYESETLVVSLKREEIFLRLAKGISNGEVERGIPKTLQGWVNDDRFEMTVRLRRQQLFFPVIRGRVEATSKGSLIFITYSLFPGTRLLMSFWSIILPLIAVGITVEYKNYLIPAVFGLFVVVMHIVARANFRLHLATTRAMLHKLLLK
jgi:hypothetical protein